MSETTLTVATLPAKNHFKYDIGVITANPVYYMAI